MIGGGIEDTLAFVLSGFTPTEPIKKAVLWSRARNA